MTKGYQLSASGLTIWDEARTPFTTDGRLVNFLPNEMTSTFLATYPDAIKGRIDMWSYKVQYSQFTQDPYFTQCYGAASVGALGQEWSSIVDLGPAPAGANIFIGRARITRTVSPSHAWVGETLHAPPFSGLHVPVHGSMMLEQGIGISRALSIYIADGSDGAPGPAGRLVAFLEHSVSPRCGGFRQWGQQLVPSNQNSTGGENRWAGGGAGPALPVFIPGGPPGRKFSSASGGYSFGSNSAASMYRIHRWDGTAPPVYSDPTNYASTYSVELSGRFGRAQA